MVLPIVLIGPFFFLGLPLRTTLVCCVLTMVSYFGFATLYGLPRPVLIRSDLLLLSGIVACLIAFWNLEKTSRLSFLEGNLIAELAQRDPLTGAKNRRAFDEQLDDLWRQAIDDDKALAIALIDVDHFKAYNDHYGHQAGDQTLRRVAQTIQKFVRQPPDLLTRYGGEEFAVILYDVSDERARDIAERIRQAVAEMAIEHCASRTSSRVTISIGVAAIRPCAERNPGGAVQLADQALYEAKVDGRNRVALMDETQHSLLVTGVFAINPDRAGNDRAA
jgi:diguanylate cyclase (GGDEF)-like protein